MDNLGEGYLVDDLEYEDPDSDKFSYLGPVGKTYMVYVRCGKFCDFYYSEILIGKLYVGYLYTLEDDGEFYWNDGSQERNETMKPKKRS